ncbi:ninja-family protein AFP3-like [Zingiber officinale]|uniref:ninja-family protein AFP3-like n=1 Tax=Zingiber officinale TaxID=94328 RepID=UPI001C4B886E|nr:ninja-family protein AFP3-like [Zingiber officinale]XP_042430390.1 ninja-family protein AFP3-like [Zingiber officinale]
MEAEAEAAEGDLERHSSAIESFPRDLLRRLGGTRSSGEHPDPPGEDSEEVELNLNLGLSIGGCFELDPDAKKLIRSSSVASFSPLPRDQEFPAFPPTSLVRTGSLPSEAEEERRKRKQLQGLRRLEAKRKRLEKRNSIKSGAARSDEGVDAGKRTLAAPVATNGRLDLPIGSQFQGVFTIAVPLRLSEQGSQSKGARAQASAGSQRCSSSDNQTPVRESTITSGIRSASTNEAATTLAAEGKQESSERNTVGEMPCVFTRGDGPNGRRIEGFLYKYKKGEEIRIVCVCHGNFFTPAEFVTHAGGTDVDHPLRHIVVCPPPRECL